MLLGNIAVRFAGHRLEWDAAQLSSPTRTPPAGLVRTEYRKGWDLGAL